VTVTERQDLYIKPSRYVGARLHFERDRELHLKLGHVKVESLGPRLDSRKVVTVPVHRQAPNFARQRCDGSKTGPAFRDRLDQEGLCACGFGVARVVAGGGRARQRWLKQGRRIALR
jgi:hypothetical protein